MMIIFIVLQLWAGLLYAQLMEWVLHKYVLHGIGKKRDAPFSFHFHEHHRASRTQLFHDEHYRENPWGWNAAGKETYSLIGLAILHLPVAVVLPFFWLGSVLSACHYFYAHRRSHLDPEWCKRTIPWHYDHHMGPNQDMNWGVTTDLFDRLLGTRQVYLGTEREQRETARRERRLAKKSA
jgi:sterol desaturase/sphingolipid hydroxylase (fatty acid hydroxylase superfamily)